MEADNEIEYSMPNIYQVWLGIHTCGMEEEKAGLIRERSQTDRSTKPCPVTWEVLEGICINVSCAVLCLVAQLCITL